MDKELRRKEWEVRVAAYRASDQSVSEWCKCNDVGKGQMYYWLGKFRDESMASTSPEPAWVSIEVDGLKEPECCLLIRVGKATVEVKLGFDKALLKDVVQTLVMLC